MSTVFDSHRFFALICGSQARCVPAANCFPPRIRAVCRTWATFFSLSLLNLKWKSLEWWSSRNQMHCPPFLLSAIWNNVCLLCERLRKTAANLYLQTSAFAWKWHAGLLLPVNTRWLLEQKKAHFFPTLCSISTLVQLLRRSSIRAWARCWPVSHSDSWTLSS